MTAQISEVIFIGVAALFIALGFVAYVLRQEKTDCDCSYKATFDSYHKQVCIDCGKEFPAKKEVKK
jgi:hypothetical protein